MYALDTRALVLTGLRRPLWRPHISTNKLSVTLTEHGGTLWKRGYQTLSCCSSFSAPGGRSQWQFICFMLSSVNGKLRWIRMTLALRSRTDGVITAKEPQREGTEAEAEPSHFHPKPVTVHRTHTAEAYLQCQTVPTRRNKLFFYTTILQISWRSWFTLIYLFPTSSEDRCERIDPFMWSVIRFHSCQFIVGLCQFLKGLRLVEFKGGRWKTTFGDLRGLHNSP